MHMPGRLGAGAKDLEAPLTFQAQEIFADDGPGGIAGAENEDLAG